MFFIAFVYRCHTLNDRLDSDLAVNLCLLLGKNPTSTTGSCALCAFPMSANTSSDSILCAEYKIMFRNHPTKMVLVTALPSAGGEGGGGGGGDRSVIAQFTHYLSPNFTEPNIIQIKSNKRYTYKIFGLSHLEKIPSMPLNYTNSLC
ncbi:hypothetical protein ACJX0J_016332, partial [Zea mays]